MCKFQQAMFSVKILFFTLCFISINSFGQEIFQEYFVAPNVNSNLISSILAGAYPVKTPLLNPCKLTDVNFVVNVNHKDTDISLISPSVNKGPGGVGHTNGASALVLWANPDHITETNGASFSNWVDASGYGSHLSQSNTAFQPIIKKNELNGYDVVRFGTGNRRLDKTNFIHFPTQAISGFYVNKTSDNDAESDAPLSYAIAGSNNDFRFLNSSKLRMYRNASNEQPDWDLTDGNWYILGFRWEGVGGKPTISKNGDNAYGGPSDPNSATRELKKGTEIPAGGTFSLAGDLDIHGDYEAGKSHQGDFSEVILFNTFITEAERIIIANYLSAKYNIALDTSIDFYDEDTNGNFDYDVAGIGQAYDGSNHTDSQGTGIVRMHTPSDLDDNDFLFWGRDNKTSFAFQTNTGNYKERLSSNWRVSKTNAVGLGTVTVEIDITGIDLSDKPNCRPLQLVVDNNADLLTPTATYTLLNTTGNIYQATEVSFNNNDYFTIEYVDDIVWDGASSTYYNVGVTGAPDTTDTCLKLLVKAGAAVTLTHNANLREVEVEPGGTLQIGDGVILTITNGIINNDTIHVLGEGQVVQTHEGGSLNTGSRGFTIPQEGTSNKYDYNYWSSSVTTVDVEAPQGSGNYLRAWRLWDFEFGGSAFLYAARPINFTQEVDAISDPISISIPWLQTFNGASGDYYYWNQIDPETTLIKPGEGFSMKGPGISGPFTFKGVANDGEYTLPATSGNDYLVGNPYPSDLNADQFITDNASVIDGTLYFWEQFGNANTHILGDYEGGYATYNGLMGIAAGGAKDTVKPAPTGRIAVGQGFFVTIKDTISPNGKIIFNNGQRVFNKETDPAIFYKTTQKKSKIAIKPTADTRTKIWFTMADENKFKRVIGLGYDANATAGYDSGLDAYLANFFPDNFYWTLDADKLMVQGLPSFSKTDEIDLGVEVVNSGTYTFGIDKSENLPENTAVYLKDKDTNTYYNLLDDTPVALVLVAGTNYANRYAITYAKEMDDLSIESPGLSSVSLSYSKENQQLTINNYPSLSSISSLKVYNLTGQIVLSLKTVETNTIQLPKVSNGVYVLEIFDIAAGQVIQKFVKK